MKAIHKYRIGNERNLKILSLKKGFRVVHSEYVITEKAVFLWIEEPLSVDIKTEEVAFRLALSGDPIADNFYYVASAIDVFGPEAYHIFMEQKENVSACKKQTHFVRAA
jgi:hypothetical protein